MRSDALWLEELAAEARAHKAWLLAGWVNAAEALRSAIHAHESERGPLVEALFPAWRGASLRRHIDQALAAETELQRRLASGYVVRRLAELSTRSAVGPALEALAAAGAAWAAERDRPALAGAKANEVRDGLLAAACEASHLLERVRWLVRAALARRPELLEVVFPKRTHSAGRDTTSSGSAAPDETSEAPAPDLAEPNRRAPPRRRSAEAAGKIAPAPEESGRTPRAGATRRRSASKLSASKAASKVSGTLMSSALDVKVSNTSAAAPRSGATRRRSGIAHTGPAPTQGGTRRGTRHRSRPPRRS